MAHVSETYRSRTKALAAAVERLERRACDYASRPSQWTHADLIDAALDMAAKARTLAGRNG